MALSPTNIVAGQRIRAAHISQFYDLLTGTMTDQPVTLKNILSLGGNQTTSANLLTLTGVASQTGDYLRVMPDGAASPTLSINSDGRLVYDYELELGEVTTPDAPAAGCVIYSKAGGGLYTRPVGGSEEQVATRTNTLTLTNKTLTSPVVTTPQINDTSADHQYVFAVSELAADRNVTLPLLTGDDEFVFKDHAVTMTNKGVGDHLDIAHVAAPAAPGASKTRLYIKSDGELYSKSGASGNEKLVGTPFARSLMLMGG